VPFAAYYGPKDLVGDSLVRWLWGGFAVGHPTLARFFSLHFTMPSRKPPMVDRSSRLRPRAPTC
jgi:hypothetical protein